MRNLCVAEKLSCEVTKLPFQANANYETLLIDFALNKNKDENVH